VLLTALLFRDLIPVIAARLYGDAGDPLLNAAILAWNATHVPLSNAWWNFPSFAPLSGITAFTEHLLGAYPIASPIVWTTGNPALAYNLLLVLCFPLNGVATYLLVRELTRSGPAAFVAGLAFMFAPYHAEHLAHVQILMAFGMPLALFGLHRYAATGHLRALTWFGIGWLSVLLSSAYMLIFFPILAALWSAWFLRRFEWRRWGAIGLTAVLATLPAVPLLFGYHERQAAYGLTRSYDEIRQMSADVTAILGISRRSIAWKGVLPDTYFESSLFPGLAILGLALYAVWMQLRLARPAATAMRPLASPRVLGATAVGLTLTLVLLHPIRPRDWIFTAGLLAAAGAAAQTRLFRAAWSLRDAVTFYFAAAVVMWLLALGPEPTWSGVQVLTHGPYWLLLQLPGAQSIRVPARAWEPAALCLAVCAGHGAEYLLRATTRTRMLAALLAIAIVGEGWFTEGTATMPQPLPKGLIPPDSLVLDLPIGSGYTNATAQYLAVIDGYRAVNGYSGYAPPHFASLRDALASHDDEGWNAFRRLADLYVVVRPEVDPPFLHWLRSQEGITPAGASDSWTVYRLPQLHKTPRARLPLPLPRPGEAVFVVRTGPKS
jgi:hypothetical protein